MSRTGEETPSAAAPVRVRDIEFDTPLRERMAKQDWGWSMTVRSHVELLRQVPLFMSVDPEQLQALIFSSRRRAVQAGLDVFRRAQAGGSAYLVVDGAAEALIGEEEQLAALVRRGAFLGELSMIANLPYSLTVRATTDMLLVEITYDMFHRFCQEFPDAGARILGLLCERLGATAADLREAGRLFREAKSFMEL